MGFTGYTPYPIARFTSLVELDDVTNLPLGVAAVARNVQFHLTSVRTRDGINQRLGNAWVGMNTGTKKPVTGLYSFKYNGNGVTADKQVPMVYDQAGNLFIESPAGSGTLTPVTPALNSDGNPLLSIPAGAVYLEATQTLNRAYLSFFDITRPLAASSVPAVYDLNTGILDPNGMKLFGQQWTAGTKYVVGEIVTPIIGGNGTGTGRSFRVSAITTGISGNAEPVWPGDGGSVVNGGVTFTENTMIFSAFVPPPDAAFNSPQLQVAGKSGALPASGFQTDSVQVPGAGGIAVSRDVYIAVTLVNGKGETSAVTVLAYLNTAANARVQVKVISTVRAWLSGLGGLFAPTGFNVYEADVATGSAAPALASFKAVGAGGFSLAINTTVNVDAAGAGAAPPTVNTAAITTAGNIDAGQRWSITLFVNRNGYISGMTQPSAVTNNFDVAGFQVFAQNIAIGPANTTQRIVAFTVAGGSSAGPYAYIPAADNVAGIPITSTVINDNVTTTATFNFYDTYLTDLMAGSTNVTAYFDKIQVPQCSKVYFSKTLNRVIYMPLSLPSGAYISPERDPETIFASTGLVQIAENDGHRLIGWLDWNGVQYALKENSGHEVDPSPNDPTQWAVRLRWSGVGPCGFRAYDAGRGFFAFVHRSGVYLYFGEKPVLVNEELPITWRGVNWTPAAMATIWVMIDDDTREMRIGLPMGNSPVPNKVLKCNFEQSPDFNPPVHATIYSQGKFISSAAARKWSIDDIPANSCIRAERSILNAPPDMDLNTTSTQILYASSDPDGAINAVTPGVYNDNSLGFNSIYETVAPGELLKLTQFGGVQANVGGLGAIGMTGLSQSNKAAEDGGPLVKERKLKDCIAPNVGYKSKSSGIGERWRLRVENKGVPDVWFDLRFAAIYARPVFISR